MPHTDPLGVFTLSRPHGVVRAVGVRERFADARAAAAALRTGQVPAVTGCVPFDLDDPAGLIAPTYLQHHQSAIEPRSPAPRTVLREVATPEPDIHRKRVRQAVDAIADGALSKVVLARAVDLQVDPAPEPAELFAAFLAGNAERNAFAVDLGAAGGSADGRGDWLIGASPELLVRRRGRKVTCRPFAGSAPRSADPLADKASADLLLSSAKDRREHAFVVDHLRERLATVCDDVDAPSTPTLASTGEIWHFATTLHGTLTDPTTSVLDLALLLGPTPAVCGTPDQAAAQFIREVEGARGPYAGAVGWCDADGDGEWMVAIRCLQLFADRSRIRTWAGGGIVAGSDPQAELDETSAKLRTVRTALGLMER